ncbi:MAG TPA: flagellar hook-length control protein FliK [Methylococcaceae bacterium]|nr:flagellar hook-length control protein FliK [Methylococcaceae bacterium]
MSIDNALTLSPALASRLIDFGNIPADLAEAGYDQEVFVQALLQQLQGLGVNTDAPAEVRAIDTEVHNPLEGQFPHKAAPGSADGSDLGAFFAQLKILAAQATLVGADQAAESAVDGNLPDASGKLLPDTDEALKEKSEDQELTPEQLVEVLAQFVAQQPQVRSVTEANPDPALAGQASLAGEMSGALVFPREVLDVPDLSKSSALTGLARAAEMVESETEFADGRSAMFAMAAGVESGRSAAKPTPFAAGANSVDGGVVMTPELLETALKSGQARSANDSPDSSATPGMAGAPADLANSDKVLPDMKIAPPEIAVMHRQPTMAPVKEVVPPMDIPVGQPGWSQELGERVLWMSGKGLQAAELRLHPAHLGPLEVRIDLDRDQASVQFVSQHAAVRETIEAAIPKLREMLGAQQLNLTEVSVSQQSFAGHSDHGNARFASGQQPGPDQQGFAGQVPEEGSTYPESEPALPQTGKGLLSLYA